MTFEIDGFTPIDILGRGGFGVVHRAADDVHGREVAVKVLGRIGDDSARRRFDRERRAMGTLSGHPNIGVVYTSGFTANEEPYIVMEMIRGGSLADRLEREGPLPAAEVTELGITLAEALQHAHEGGVLHLDLKPENILMSQFGRPKLVDFGIAAMIHEDTSTSTIRATPSFADPEVLEGRPGTVGSDVYGLVRQRDNPSSVTTPVLPMPTSAPISDPVRPSVSIVDGEVPDVVGLSGEEARAALRDAGYRAVTDPHCYDEVSGQVPSARAELDDGEPVELVFEPCTVPDFVGDRLPAAISVVEDDIVVGLRISWPQHCDDMIIAQSIAPGTVVEPGTVVDLELPTDC